MPLLNDAKACYVGTQPITKIYAGNAQVWPKELADPDMIYLTHCDKWNNASGQIEEYKNSTYIKNSESKNKITTGGQGKFNDCYDCQLSSPDDDERLTINFTDNPSLLKNQEFTIDLWHRINKKGSGQPTGAVPMVNLEIENNSPAGDGSEYPLLMGADISNGSVTAEIYAQGQSASGYKKFDLGFARTDVWMHLAFWWKGTPTGYTWNVWVNGMTPDISGKIYNLATETPYLKRLVMGVSTTLYSHQSDEVRISKGRKYTGNFTPPTEPYSIY